jgi:hypothetical protein
MDAAMEVSEAVMEEVTGSDNGRADLTPQPRTTEDGDPAAGEAVRDTGASMNGAVDPPRVDAVATQATGTTATDEVPASDGSAAATASVETDDDDPPALPGYQRMTLAQVRGHLRELSVGEVTALLQYEQSADNRAPFLTLLSNRLVTLDAQHS